MPFAGAQHPVARDDRAAVPDDQPDRMIGDILVVRVLRVADQQAARRRPGDVDPVIADREAGDQPELGHPVDQRAIDREFARDDDRADIGEFCASVGSSHSDRTA